MTTGSHPSDSALRTLLDRAPDLIFRYRLRPTPGIEFVNEATTRITGYTPAEHYADPELVLKIVHPDDRALFEDSMRSGAEQITLRWRRKDGTVIWSEHRTVPVYDDAGQIVALEGIAREIPCPETRPSAPVRVVGGVRIDVGERRVHADGREVHLTPAEFKLLLLLTDEPGRVVTRAEMMRRLWRSAHVGNGHTCEAHVSNLRRKLEPDRANPTRVLTVRGGGYRFSAAA